MIVEVEGGLNRAQRYRKKAAAKLKGWWRRVKCYDCDLQAYVGLDDMEIVGGLSHAPFVVWRCPHCGHCNRPGGFWGEQPFFFPWGTLDYVLDRCTARKEHPILWQQGVRKFGPKEFDT